MTREYFWTNIRFLCMGAIAIGTSYAIFYTFVYVWHLWYLGSSIFAMTLNYVMTFLLHKFFTYRERSTASMVPQMLRYAAMVGLVFIPGNALGMYLLVDGLGRDALIAQVIMSGVLTVISMWLSPKVYRTS